MAGKERSPNYPGLSLDQAVQAIQKIYDRERRTVVPTLSVARALGHENLSGPALTKLAALRQYGLLEDVSPGKVKVSEQAMAILLRAPGDPEYVEAIRGAAVTPALFAELYKDYPHSSEATLRYHLIKERSFSEEGATRVIKTFRATVLFAKLVPPGYGGTNISSADEQAPGGAPSASLHILPDTIQRALDPSYPRAGLAKVAYTWPLPDGTDVQVSFQQRPTAKAIERLISYLEIMKEDTPSQ